MEKKLSELYKAAKFAIVGVANTLIDMGVFALLTQLLALNIYLAQVISYMAGMLNSYIFNRSWTFRSNEHFFSPALVRFLVVNVAMLLLSTGLLWLFHDLLGLPTLLAKGGSVLFTLVVNFVINRLWVFST